VEEKAVKIGRWVTAMIAAAMLGSVAIVVAGEQHESGWAGREHAPGSDMFGGGFFGPGSMERMGDQLGLSAEQRQAIKTIFDAARPQMQTMRDNIHSNLEKLRSTQPDDPNYATVVAQVSQSAGELASRMVTEGSQVRSQVYALLTKEQKAKLPEIEAQMKDQAHERFQHHRSPATPSSGGTSKPST
jgi:Spy/CpxP family protein refolding chaperone